MADATAYRTLDSTEIAFLEADGCTAEDWALVEVEADGGVALPMYRQVHFSGRVRLHGFDRRHVEIDGVPAPLGITRAHLHECTIGRNVRINNIGSYIAHMDIDDDAIVENVDLLAVEDASAFGNGVRVPTVNEAGGREVLIHDRLTAQEAYLLAMYRHRPGVVAALEALIERTIEERVHARRGRVGAGARVTNNKTLVNVRIGPHARVKGVVRLRNGTVHSSEADPTTVGDGVIAEDFLIGVGSVVDGGAFLERCFVGQGVRIGKQFSAENSLVFANSELYHGEACAVFAGPFTVSHHKGSLLLTALYSFYNAGSGTNFSNHMYKLGPVHQGILERGCKTGSFSHVYWPSRVGAFSTVLGRHPHHVDTADLPFSYLIESEGESLVVPGANLFTVGARRDAVKWLGRDRRRDPDRLDRIAPGAFNPYTVGRILAGRDRLQRVEAATPSTEHLVAVDGVRITRSRLQKGAEAYALAAARYLGDTLLPLLEESDAEPVAALHTFAAEADPDATGPWIDAAGLLLPSARMEAILDDLEAGRFATIDDLEAAFAAAHEAMPRFERAWALARWTETIGKPADAVDVRDLADLVRTWRDAVRRSNAATLKDATKEFEPSVQVSFGIDGDEAVRQADFRAVRGAYADHAFVTTLEDETRQVETRAERLLDRLASAS